MRSLKLACLFILCIQNVAAAATVVSSDQCHVYVMDVLKAREAFENFRETGNAEAEARALQTGTTIVGKFLTTVGEEELTNKSYPFPGSKLIITASVFYTDESMAAESMMLGIAVADKALGNALSGAHSAVAEVNYDKNTRTVRVKKMIDVEGRSFLVGLQCDPGRPR